MHWINRVSEALSEAGCDLFLTQQFAASLFCHLQAEEGMALYAQYFFYGGRHGHDGLQRLGRTLEAIRQKGSVYQRSIWRREVQTDQRRGVTGYTEFGR